MTVHRTGFYPLRQIEGQVPLLLCKRLLSFVLIEWFRAEIMILSLTPPYVCVNLPKGIGKKSLPRANAGAPFQNINLQYLPGTSFFIKPRLQDSATCRTGFSGN